MELFQNIIAVFIKQLKDTTKNVQVLILFMIFPVVTFLMLQGSIKKEDMFSYLAIFATMHCVFTPIVATSSIIAEEKEKTTLRFLIMSGVNSIQYLISIGGFVLIAVLISGCSFLAMLNFSSQEILKFILALMIGTLMSIILGMCIGSRAKSMSACNGIAIPISLVFAFGPMLASVNSGMEKITKFTYGQQVSYLINGKENISIENVLILAANFAVLLILFLVFYKKNILAD